MDELTQWCEIYGHVWLELWVEMGGSPALRLKRHLSITRTCTKCLAGDHKVLIPA